MVEYNGQSVVFPHSTVTFFISKFMKYETSFH